MPSPLSLAVGYNTVVTHGRRSCNNVVATDLAGVLRGSGLYKACVGRVVLLTFFYLPSVLLGNAAFAMRTLSALRGTSGSATMTTPGVAGTPRKALQLPRARRIGFSHKVGALTQRGSGPSLCPARMP